MLSLPPITLRLRGWKLIDRVALAFLLLCMVGGGSCQAGKAAQAQRGQTRAALEDDIREVVLRFQMERWIRDLDQDEAKAKDPADKEAADRYNFKIFFVATDGIDPSDDFIKRFQSIPRIVKKSSDAEVVQISPVVDRVTRQRGIIFSADGIRWLGRSHVKVAGGYHCDGLCGADYTFDVRLEKGTWSVKKAHMNWIS